MNPIDFAQRNTTFTHPECRDLPAYKDQEKIISCWSVNDEELELIQASKRIFISIYGISQPPILPSIGSPFINTPLESIIDYQDNLYTAAAETFGYNFNLIKAMEEAGELIQAIAKRLNTEGLAGNELNGQICEELVDVKILLSILEKMLNKSMIRAEMIKKLKRLDDRITEKINSQNGKM